MLKAFSLGLVLAVAGCASFDTKNVTSKTFDTICSSEPAVYAAYVTVAVSKNVSEKKLATAAAAHSIVTGVCASPPTNLAQGVAAIAAAYATIVSARAETARQGA